MLLDVESNKRFGQASFWDACDSSRSDALMHVMDKINQRMGKNTLRIASAAMQGEWHMRRSQLSPSYMTRWEDVPIVSCRR